MSYKNLTDNQRWKRNLGIINDFMFLSQTELMEKYDCGSETVQRVLRAYLNRNKGHKPEPNKKQYYANEEEMIIQDYRIEDLTGEEKLILNNL